MSKLIQFAPAALAAFALASPLSLRAAETDALLKVLVRKGILNEKEAAAVQAEADKETAKKEAAAKQAALANNSGAKLKLSAPVQELKISGDGRLRFQGENAKVVGTSDHGERDRWRYRLRLGMDWKMTDNWLFGFGLEAGPSIHSANVTMGENFGFNKAGVTTTSAVTGVTTGKVVTGIDAKTGKATTGTVVTGVKTSNVVTKVNWEDTIFLGKLFLKYQPADWLTLQGGRMANPFVQGNVGAAGSSSLVWDPDVNPQGFAEQFKWTFGGGSSSLAKDGKTVVTSDGPSLDLFANFGQFVYEDVQENNFDSFPSRTQTINKMDRWMLGWQIGARANFNKTTWLQVAPSIYNYNGGGDNLLKAYNGDGPQVVLNDQAEPTLVTFNQFGVNDLTILDIPAEFGWTMGNTPFLLFGEYANNLNAGQRATKAGHADKNQGVAYSAGLGINKIKKKGDWELKAWWQHAEQFSLDPNLIDDDVFNGRLNFEGFVVRGAYAFTDFASLSLVYSRGSRIDSELGTGGGSSLGTLPLQNDQLFLIDLNLKF